MKTTCRCSLFRSKTNDVQRCVICEEIKEDCYHTFPCGPTCEDCESEENFCYLCGSHSSTMYDMCNHVFYGEYFEVLGAGGDWEECKQSFFSLLNVTKNLEAAIIKDIKRLRKGLWTCYMDGIDEVCDVPFFKYDNAGRVEWFDIPFYVGYKWLQTLKDYPTTRPAILQTIRWIKEWKRTKIQCA